MALSCLAGAVVALGVTLVARPSKVIEHRVDHVATRPIDRPTSAPRPGFPAEHVAAQASPSVARLDVEGPSGWQVGSAVLMHEDGTMLTSARLVRGAKQLVVTFDDGRVLGGKLLGSDAQTGLAVVTAAVQARKPAQLAEHRPVVGQPAAMVGGPGPASKDGTVTTSAVRALGRQLDGDEGPLHDMIEADRPVMADTDGGALVDSKGAVLGICLHGTSTEVGYAVPVDVARKVDEALRHGGKVRWVWLGVEANNLDPGRARDLGIPGGASLEAVEARSPAAAAGLREGDVIIGLGQRPVESAGDLVSALRTHAPGDRIDVTLRRGSSLRQVRVTLGAK